MPNPNPSPSTRFTSENNPRPGRKKGQTNARSKRIDKKLDDMLGDAHKNIQESLKKGHVGTSMWLVDKVSKERGTRVEEGVLKPLADALETIEDVERISKHALVLAISGDMSFEQLKAVQEALARHSVLAGVIELRKLREEVEAMSREAEPAAEIGKGHLPSWGKLKPVDVPDAEVTDERDAG